jgi:hypothetical protein
MMIHDECSHLTLHAPGFFGRHTRKRLEQIFLFDFAMVRQNRFVRYFRFVLAGDVT